MMRATLQSNFTSVKAKMRRATLAAVKAAGEHAVSELKSVLSEPYPPASRPGELPRMRTGAGRDAVSLSVNPRQLSADIYVEDSGKHLTYLEFGTRYIEPRPWFSVTIQRITPVLHRISLQAVKVALR